METTKTEEASVTPEENTGEETTEEETQENIVTLSKEEYDTLNQTLGSLKKEVKDLKKSKETPKETPKSNQTDSDLLQKAFLRSAAITAEDEVELALETARKWDMSVDKLVDDEDFQIKLDKLRTKKSNEQATSGVRGDASGSDTKNTPEYWIAKGAPPTREDVPDRKTRAKIARAFLSNQKQGKTFYNE